MILANDCMFALGKGFAMGLVEGIVWGVIGLVISRRLGFIVTVILREAIVRSVEVICRLLLFTFHVAFSETQVVSFIRFYIFFTKITSGSQLDRSFLLKDWQIVAKSFFR